MRELIRKDQDRLQLRNLLLAGTASAPADASDFEGLRDRLRKTVETGANCRHQLPRSPRGARVVPFHFAPVIAGIPKWLQMRPSGRLMAI